MAELAKLHMSVDDQSTFATGVDTLIPLYVIATASNKVIDETTGEIALGTTKDFAGQVDIVTSQREVIDRYGVPYFAELNGTVLQGDERNEYGLYGLYDAMGTTSLAYVLRADIDLSQLTAREEEPTSNVKNGTLWLDESNSNLGLFFAKQASSSTTAKPSKDWIAYNTVTFVDEAPNNDQGADDDIAVTILDGKLTAYRKVNGSWEIAGTSAQNVYKQSSIEYPTEYAVNDLWLKTTAINGGISLALKRWVASLESWTEVAMPAVTSFIDAEATLGSTLGSNSLCMKFELEGDTAKQIVGEAYIYTPISTALKISATSAFATLSETKTMTLRYVEDGALKKISVSATTTSTAESVAHSFEKAIKENGSTKVRVANEEGKLVIYSDIPDMELSGDITSFGFAAEKEGYNKAGDVWTKCTTITAQKSEPRAKATEGTLWFNDDLMVDIMVNNGSEWKGFENYYTTETKPGIYVTSEEPTGTIQNESLWIDTGDDNYPTIRRYFDGDWELLNNSDQTTPNGVVFADARYYDKDGNTPTYSVTDGKVTSTLLISDNVDPDCVNPQTYPAGIILFNTRFSTNNVKEFKEEPFEGLYKLSEDDDHTTDYEYTVGKKFYVSATDAEKLFKNRWVSASGNASDGSGLFGAKAQRKMVVNAMADAIKSNEDIRTFDYDFFFATCPGYPELDDELISLNTEKKEMFEIVSDCPKTLEPNATKIQAWATNANNATSHGDEGRVLKNTYVVRNYPSMGLTSNVDGSEIAVPTSIAKMRNLLVLPRGQIAAGTQYGQVTNLASVGYITDEDEYASVVIKDGLGEVLISKDINPIMPRRGTGLLFWGERTENNVESSLSDEHAIITLLRIKRQLEQFCQPYFFRINTEALRADFERGIRGILGQYISTNELYDFAVSMERNTAETIQRRELWCDISLEIAKGIEQIYLPIHIVATGTISGS